MTPLFDITVDKILHIVTVELACLTAEDEVTKVGSNRGDNTDATETDDTGIETETDQDDDADLGAASHTTLTSDLSALGGFGPEATHRPTLHASSSGQTRVSELSHEAPPCAIDEERFQAAAQSPSIADRHPKPHGQLGSSCQIEERIAKLAIPERTSRPARLRRLRHDALRAGDHALSTCESTKCL
jgi:hypothetical protein